MKIDIATVANPAEPAGGSARRAVASAGAGLLAGLLVVMAGVAAAQAGRPQGLAVNWGDGFTSLRFRYLGQKYEYPRDLRADSFVPVGGAPQFQVTRQWPVVAVRARWAIPRDHWPEPYRDRILPLMLMRACDAELYPRLYPEAILGAQFLAPPPWLATDADPLDGALPRLLRGKTVRYQIKADAGFGASDYTIRTQIQMGLSEDGKAIFYFDRPSYISDHLVSREFLCAACDTGREIRFEVCVYCVCAPRYLFRGEAMRRVESDCRYLIRRLYEEFEGDFGPRAIEQYVKTIREKRKQRGGAAPARAADPPAQAPAADRKRGG